MTSKEKKLLLIFLLLLAVGVIAKGIPFVYQQYQQRKQAISLTQQKIARLQALIKKQIFWQQEYDKAIKQQQFHQSRLFHGGSNELVAARIQSQIKELAKQAGIQIESIRQAEFQQAENWLLISLSVNFKAASDNFIRFLTLLKKHPKKISVKSLAIRSYRNQINGSFTLVGMHLLAGEI